MSPYLIFEKFWNTEKSHLDFLIYAPHPSTNRDFIAKVRETVKVDISHISDEMLAKYLYHEADIGVIETMNFVKKFLANSPYSLGFLWVDIPRGFCDLNRPIELATPKILENNFWENIYTEVISDVEKIFKNADFIFQFHSMNSYNPMEKKNFDECIQNWNLEYIYERMYNGNLRNYNILTKDVEGKYLTNADFDNIFRKIFVQKNFVLDENVAYQFYENYPHNIIAKNYPSGFFELIKWSIATDETANSIDTNNIIFDEKKLEKMWKILSEIIMEYLENFSRK